MPLCNKAKRPAHSRRETSKGNTIHDNAEGLVAVVPTISGVLHKEIFGQPRPARPATSEDLVRSYTLEPCDHRLGKSHDNNGKCTLFTPALRHAPRLRRLLHRAGEETPVRHGHDQHQGSGHVRAASFVLLHTTASQPWALGVT